MLSCQKLLTDDGDGDGSDDIAGDNNNVNNVNGDDGNDDVGDVADRVKTRTTGARHTLMGLVHLAWCTILAKQLQGGLQMTQAACQLNVWQDSVQ